MLPWEVDAGNPTQSQYPGQSQQAHERQEDASPSSWVVSVALVESSVGHPLAPLLDLGDGGNSTLYLCSVHRNPPGFWTQ